MEDKKQIIIDVTTEPIIEKKKTPIQEYRDEFIAGIDMGFNAVERGFEAIGKLAQSLGLGK